jgi:RNA polymerase sigma-70 factor (ECF subfamily)
MNDYLNRLEAFYREHRRSLYACALTVTRCPEHAEDAIHDAFCRLAGRPFAMDDMRAYVFRAVRNAAVDQLRRRPPPAAPLNGSLFDPGPDPAQLAGRAEFQGQAIAALNRLGDDERETIVQHLWGGLTFREIAETRDKPIGTVTSWYRRGIDRMRQWMEE